MHLNKVDKIYDNYVQLKDLLIKNLREKKRSLSFTWLLKEKKKD